MTESKCYCVLSLRQLLEAVTEAQKPSTDGCPTVTIANCVVLEGVAIPASEIHEAARGQGLQFDVRKIRRV